MLPKLLVERTGSLRSVAAARWIYGKTSTLPLGTRGGMYEI